MTDQAGKPAPPTDEDWREAIDSFKRYREFDTAKFRDNAADLVLALRRKAKRADAAATLIDHEYRRQFQPHDLLEHDKTTLINQLKDDGYAKQLDLARLELLCLDPIDPWLDQADPYGVMSVVPTPLLITGDVDSEHLSRLHQLADQLHRWGLDAHGIPIRQRPIRLLRLQAERLSEGAARAQLCVDHYKSRLAAIRRYSDGSNPSVATHDLLWTVEPWNVDVGVIADHLVTAKVFPAREAEHDDLRAQWCGSLKRARAEWRKVWKRKKKRS